MDVRDQGVAWEYTEGIAGQIAGLVGIRASPLCCKLVFSFKAALTTNTFPINIGTSIYIIIRQSASIQNSYAASNLACGPSTPESQILDTNSPAHEVKLQPGLCVSGVSNELSRISSRKLGDGIYHSCHGFLGSEQCSSPVGECLLE